jgi:DNA primase
LISKESIENLKNNIDIVDTISNYVELKKAGVNFKGLCPFHNEKTSSFVVSPVKQIFHCFGCGVSGDSIKFVMELEKLSYPDTIEKLAKDNNFSLTYDKNYDKKNHQIMEQINKYFIGNLKSNKEAFDYLINRGITKDSIELFGIGYSPTNKEVMKFLLDNHISNSIANEYGLIVVDNNEIYARFIQRITFPIKISNSNIVGFGGRTISNHPAKYINSPTTKYFNKSKLFYGLDVAKHEIYKTNKMIITEGYLDTILLHQAGYKNSVASLGTALTKEHIPLLKKLPATITLAYDGDSAGKQAAIKASMLLCANSIDGGVVLFDEGVDPADLVKNGEFELLNNLFKQPIPLIPFVFKSISESYDLSIPEEKQNAFHELNKFFATLSQFLQEEYKKEFASIIKINENLIKIRTPNNKKIVEDSNTKLPEDIAELSIIKTLLEDPRLIEQVLDFIHSNMFNTHKLELDLVIENRLDEQKLIGISLREDIEVQDESRLVSHLCKFLIRFYKKERDLIKHRDISIREYGFIVRAIQTKIDILKKGTLVEFENFSDRYKNHLQTEN